MGMNVHSPSQAVLVNSGFHLAPTNATQVGTAVDTLGFSRALLVFHVTTGAGTTAQYSLADCATSGGSYSAAITGAALTAAIVASTTDVVYVQDIDLTKRQRFIKPSLIGTGTVGWASMEIILFNGSDLAVTNANVQAGV